MYNVSKVSENHIRRHTDTNSIKSFYFVHADIRRKPEDQTIFFNFFSMFIIFNYYFAQVSISYAGNKKKGEMLDIIVKRIWSVYLEEINKNNHC